METLRKDRDLRRRRFTVTMAVLAAIYGGIAAFRSLHGQIDVISDIFKIMALIAVGTAIFSYGFWTLTAYPRERKIGGAFAGILTAIFTIPLPLFVWTLKKHLLSGDTDFVAALSFAVSYAGRSFYYMFSFAEGLAIFLSAIVGYMIAVDN